MESQTKEAKIGIFQVGYSTKGDNIKIEYIALGDLLVTNEIDHGEILPKLEKIVQDD